MPDRWLLKPGEAGWPISANVEKYSKKEVGPGEARGNLGVVVFFLHFFFYVVLSQGKYKALFCYHWGNISSQASDMGKFEYSLLSEISHNWQIFKKTHIIYTKADQKVIPPIL